MALKPESSLMVGLATATLVFAVFQNATPSVADIRSVDQYNTDIEAAERQATWTSAALVSGVSLVSKDPSPFIIGGLMTIVMAWAHRHADMVNPLTGRAVADGMTMADVIPAQTQQDDPAAYGYADNAAVA